MEGRMRFAEFSRTVSGFSESMLSQRLAELIGARLVGRQIIKGHRLVPPTG
jgi:DNA-binding HxlR family transcriptional regulator